MKAPVQNPVSPRARLRLELLEDRTTPATFTVTTATDAGAGSLRDALTQANADPDPANTIVFTPALAGQAITLLTAGDGTAGPSALAVRGDIDIQGSGQTITRDAAAGRLRLFFVSPGGHLTLDYLSLSNGLAQGGDGHPLGFGGGGGGGAGLGGAIYNQGSLDLFGCTLVGNQAIGGAGGPDGNSGGGGLSGPGEFQNGGGPNGGGVATGSFPNYGGPGGFGGGGGGAYGFGGPGGFGGGGGGDGYDYPPGETPGHGGAGGFGGGGGGSVGDDNGKTESGGAAGFGGGYGTFSGGGGAGLGGAVFNQGGEVTIANTTIASNTARGGNGAIAEDGNRSQDGGAYGGGVFNLNGSLTLTNTTIAGNTIITTQSGGGGAVYNAAVDVGADTPGRDAVAILANTILAYTPGATQIENYQDGAGGSAVLDLTGPNLASSGGGGNNGTINGAPIAIGDPLLGPLGDNGGPTPTMLPLAGSPALDAGSNDAAAAAGLAADQRGVGYVRVFNGTVDLGAVEVQPAPGPVGVAPAALPDGLVGATYSIPLTASGTAGTFTFTVPAGANLDGLTLSPIGVLSGGPTAAGTFSFTVTATDPTEATGSQAYTLTVTPVPLSPPPPMSPPPMSPPPMSPPPMSPPISLPPGGSSSTAPPATLLVSNGDGANQAFAFAPAGGQLAAGPTITFPGLSGPVRTAVGVDRDGTTVYVGATAAGVLAQVVVETAGGAVLASFLPFGPAFTGGLFVAAGDFTGDGLVDLAVSPDSPDGNGIGDSVKIYDGASLVNGTTAPAVLANFLGLASLDGQSDTSFKGGARVAAGDTNGDGTPDLIVTAGNTGGPRVTVWDGRGFAGAGGGQPTINPLANLFVFESTQRGGAFVAAGDVTGDGKADLIFSGGPGGGPRVRIVDAALLLALPTSQLEAVNLDDPANLSSGLVANNFFAGDPNSRGGVRIATVTTDTSGLPTLVAASGTDTASAVTVYTGPAIKAVAGQNGVAPAAAQTLDPIGGTPVNGVYVG